MTLKEVGIIIGRDLKRRRAGGEWQVDFYGTEVKKDGTLSGSFGLGKTITEAKKDYARQLKNQTVVINAFNIDRREFQLPPTITIS